MNIWPEQIETLRNEVASAFALTSERIIRKISEFATQEITLPPTGPFGEQRFDLDRQPFNRLLFDLIESGSYCRIAVVGPTQTGKTLTAVVIPALYHLFELRENVVCGIPHQKMAYDKWEQDFLPVIKASRYADQLPVTGKGSRGGQFESITFRNGATLKFMSAHGGDENRSGVTSRILVMTEIDKYDVASEKSREGDPVTQMIARMDAFSTTQTLVYMECTPSIAEGRIWVEYTNGSAGRIMTQCPHCYEFVCLERENLVGWQDAQNEIDARDRAAFACASCGALWTDDQRVEANKNARLVHRGQTITPDGVIHGDAPRTLTAGFRWNAANNLFRPAADIGGREWSARYSPNETSSDKSVRQFMWAMPAIAEITDQTPLNVAAVLDRTHAEPRGVIPANCNEVTVGLDLGGWWCHWTAIAWAARARGYIIDYGRISVPQGTLGLEAGLMEAMRQFRDMCGRGWLRGNGEVIVPDENLIDSGWQTSRVYEFIGETGQPFRPCKGLSVAGEEVHYNRPKSTGAIVQWIGDGWHIARLKDDGIYLVEIDADVAKSTLHARLNCDTAAPGAMTLFHVDRSDLAAVEERRTFVRHLTAEKSTTEFKPGKGTITRWKKIRQANHHLDSTALALIGGSINGVSAIDDTEETESAAKAHQNISHEITQVQQRPIVRPVSQGWIRKR